MDASPSHGEARRILGLAAPVVLTGLNWTLLQVTDVVVVGMVSTHEAALLGTSQALAFVTIVAGFSCLSGVLVFASRADGAGDAARRAAVLREGVVLALAVGVALAGLMIVVAAPLLAAIGVAPELVAPGARIVRVLALGYPFSMVAIAAGFFLEGISRPGRAAAINLALLPVNAVLAWGLAGGHLGLPTMGAAGARAATAISAAFGAVAMLGAVWMLPGCEHRALRSLARADWASAPAGAWRLARFGLVPAIASALELGGFAILIGLSTDMGDTAAHAFQIVFSAHNVSFALAIGLASAAGVRVGNAVGEGRPEAATRRVGVALAMAVGSMAAMATGLALLGASVAALFPAAPAVHALAAAMLPHLAPFILFDGVQVVLVYALRSLGDQVVTGANSILAFFVVTGGAGWWLVGAGVGPMALVWASGAGMVAAALLHGARFAVLSRRSARLASRRPGPQS